MELRASFLKAAFLLVTLTYSEANTCPALGRGYPSSHIIISDRCYRRNYALTGHKGASGLQGDKGEQGFRGLKGLAGGMGPPGPADNRGQKGDAGVKGAMGRTGVPGGPGSTGPRGKQGNPGADGSPGPCGGYGFPGPGGPKGPIGEKGDAGKRGPRGPTGQRGGPGTPGKNGTPGLDGWAGEDGCKGRPGCDGPKGHVVTGSTPSKLYTIIARHGQGYGVQCPPNTTFLYNGYSLLQTDDDGRAVSQDLGRSSSCLMTFDPMPFMFCSVNNKCTYASRTGNSFWLSNINERMTMEAIKGRQLNTYISKCVVCEVPSLVVSVHSQYNTTPSCPSDWSVLWDGYSFLQTTTGAGGAGQLLHSPGSCLEHYSPYPYLECGSHGTCQYFADLYFYWLVAIQPGDWKWRDPTFNDNTMPEKRISRCRVCKYNI